MPTPRIFFPAGEGSIRPYSFSYPSDGGLVSGIEAIRQHVVMHLMATPGSDRYTDQGGGLISVMRAAMQGADFARTTADIHDAVTRTKQQMLASQVAEDLNLDEQLADLVVRSIERSKDNKIRTYISITSATGETDTLAF